MSGTVAAHSDKAPIALRICFRGKLDTVTAARCGEHVHREAATAQLGQRLTGEFRGFAAAGRGVDDGEKTLLPLGHGYRGSIAEVRSSCARRSARMFLFILSDAVRGK